MKSNLLILPGLFLCLAACVQSTPFPKPADAVRQQPESPVDPPVYVRVSEAPQSSLFAERVNVNFPPGSAVLQTALTSGLPFPVTIVAQDEYVDLQTEVAVQAQDATVSSYLQQLEGITGYQIRLQPDKKIVAVSAMITETWNLSALAGIGKFNARLGFASGDDSEGEDDDGFRTSYEMNTEQTHDDDVWDSIVEHARCILGIHKCGQYENDEQIDADFQQQTLDRTAWLVENRRLGTITAGGRPIRMEHLDVWLKQLAADSLQSVQLDCVIFDVAKNWNEVFGVDLDAAIGGDSLLQIQSGGNSTDDSNPWTLGALINEGDFDVDLLIRNLSEKSNAEVKSRIRLEVTNGATAYINTGEVFSYISDIETVATEGVATTGFNQQRLQVGLELAVTPRLIDKSGRILVEVIPILSSLLRFEVLSSGDTEVSAPVVTLRQLSSQAITRNGRPIIIGGLDLDRVSRQQSGISERLPLHHWLSTENNGYESRQLLIVITPQVVQV